MLPDPNAPISGNAITLLRTSPRSLRNKNRDELANLGFSNFEPKGQEHQISEETTNGLEGMVIPVSESQKEEPGVKVLTAAEGIDFESQCKVSVMDHDDEGKITALQISIPERDKFLIIEGEELEEFRNGYYSQIGITDPNDSERTLLEVEINMEALDRIFQKQVRQNQQKAQTSTAKQNASKRASMSI